MRRSRFALRGSATSRPGADPPAIGPLGGCADVRSRTPRPGRPRRPGRDVSSPAGRGEVLRPEPSGRKPDGRVHPRPARRSAGEKGPVIHAAERRRRTSALDFWRRDNGGSLARRAWENTVLALTALAMLGTAAVFLLIGAVELLKDLRLPAW